MCWLSNPHSPSFACLLSGMKPNLPVFFQTFSLNTPTRFLCLVSCPVPLLFCKRNQGCALDVWHKWCSGHWALQLHWEAAKTWWQGLPGAFTKTLSLKEFLEGSVRCWNLEATLVNKGTSQQIRNCSYKHQFLWLGLRVSIYPHCNKNVTNIWAAGRGLGVMVLHTWFQTCPG